MAQAWSKLRCAGTIKPEGNYKKEDGTYTETESETNRYLIRKYFPEDDETKGTEEMAGIR